MAYDIAIQRKGGGSELNLLLFSIAASFAEGRSVPHRKCVVLEHTMCMKTVRVLERDDNDLFMHSMIISW